MWSQSVQVGLDFLDNILVVLMNRHIVKKVFQLPDKDTHTGKLQRKNDMT